MILRDTSASVPRTAPIPAVGPAPRADRHRAAAAPRASSSPIGLCVVVWFILRRTTFGFEVRTVGTNPNAAKYAGMGVNRTIIARDGAVGRLRRAGRGRRDHRHRPASSAPACSSASGSTPSPSRCSPGPTRSPSSSRRSCGARCSPGAGLMQQESGPVDRRRAHRPGPGAAVRRRRRHRAHHLPACARRRREQRARRRTQITSGLGVDHVSRLRARPPPDDRRALRAPRRCSWSATWRRNLDAADKGLTFEPPPDPLKIIVRPPITLVDRDRHRSSCSPPSPPSSSGARPRLASGAAGRRRVLFIPLVLVARRSPCRRRRDTNVMQLLVESLRLGTPVALGAMAGLWCERVRRRQHRHRGDDARLGRRPGS